MGALRRAHASRRSVRGDRRGARRRARARRLRAGRVGARRSSARARSTIRSSRRSTGSTSCSTTATSGCARRGSARSRASATRSSRRSTISSTSAASCASTRRSSPRRSASASGLFATEYFDEGNAYLAQTGQLYGEAAAAAFGKIYTFGPTFRAEKSKTRRHLTEFWMIEPEVAWNDSDDNMRLQEDFVSYLVQRALERCARGAEGARARHHAARARQAALPARSTTPTRSRSSRRRGAPRSGATTSAPRTRRCIVADYDRPVFVLNYPKEAKAFYMKENPGRSAHGALRRSARARGLRRDHRRDHSARTTTTSSSRGSRRRGCRSTRTAGISTCGSTARSRTPASGSDSSAR